MLEYNVHQGVGKEYVVFLHGIGGNSRIFGKQLDIFKKSYNVITIHLPGHGESPSVESYNEKFTIDLNVREVLKVLDHLKVERAHFIGISLGSVLIHALLQTAPNRVKSAVLGGGITRFNLLSNTLLKIGDAVKNIIPFMWLYKIFAYIMMPKSNHKVSRKLFIREAKKMNRNDFLGWYRLTPYVKSTYASVQERASHIPKLYISGKEDHLFVQSLDQDTKGDPSATKVFIEDCGHVCNVEKPREFNRLALDFIYKNQGVPLRKVQ
ncbi:MULTISPECIES: alpha/beta fold hydrolase [Rossellomorea]|jgi:pimeloyl-ACP methyl ester carboxylesterase|uniref:Alpha/beta hydrolase n=1 Tax=Rossellomorea aquimaris TaxID=189382 RepID=A0A5D4UBF3_9BACI|nr:MULTISPECIES: alpha/beta hydrolase [Rossellomorea]MDT9024111.1 alpha/beta hydrolase [Rossellomorea sp. YC4-1]TYS79021.1 alpha/beta hydrolase [Rossellomorea aquimaris]TYS84766.1 alpha/beta hydrolase [Rossellomorea aquimaris]TYS91316.1 alpha/beta hydrolase [Rossellomorea aquimaris]